MEENQKQFKILSDCAQIAELLKNNPNISSSQINLHIPHNTFIEVLHEIEEFVKVRVDLSQPTVSLKMNEIEFIFHKSNK
jgi:hypothetical protein